MTIPNLAKLVPVNVKSVWPGEASSFTPWLLANAEALGEVLGMDLVLVAAEHKVGDFSLDLMGHDDATQGAVIIENQFGPTDHKHLGQLLTYAGGTNPTTVVWIAESFSSGKHRNLYLDTSRAPIFEIMQAIREIGPEKVIWGTDSPFVDYQLEFTKMSRIQDPAAYELVIGGNITRLLQEVPGRAPSSVE